MVDNAEPIGLSKVGDGLLNGSNDDWCTFRSLGIPSEFQIEAQDVMTIEMGFGRIVVQVKVSAAHVPALSAAL